MKKLKNTENLENFEKEAGSAEFLSENKRIMSKKKHSNMTFSFSKMLILTKMLLQDKLKFSFKTNKKNTIIKIASIIILFVVLSAISFLFYEICAMLNIFSVLRYIPLTVPSLIMTVLLVFGFLSCIFGLNKTLYYSRDNQIMITYPCSGSTIFFARLSSFFINEYIKNLTIQVPLLFGYMVVMGAPIYAYLGVLIAFIFITAFEVLLGSILSIPVYYISLFLKRFSVIRSTLTIIFYFIIIGGVIFLVLLLPESLDIFSNWGPYFNALQSFLSGYRNMFSFFYYLTIMTCGELNGFSYSGFSLIGLFSFLTIIGSIGILFVLALYIVNPIYFKLASESFEFETTKTKRHLKNRKRGYYISQIKKEILLFNDEGGTIIQVLGSFVVLPLLILLIDKIFGAMDINPFGNLFVQIVNLVVMLLVALNANTSIASAYSKEGRAFFMDRTYPKKGYFLLVSKLIIPMIIGSASILISGILFSNFYGIGIEFGLILGFGVITFYIGHMLYAAGLDFTNIADNFVNDSSTTKAMRNSTIVAFILPIILAVLFYLYFNDGILSGYIKVLVIGILYLILNIILFSYKVKLLYKESN